jgi:hypothetical protein
VHAVWPMTSWWKAGVLLEPSSLLRWHLSAFGSLHGRKNSYTK